MTNKMNPSFKEIHKNVRSLLSIQFHEFYRQYKERTLSPESLLEDYVANADMMDDILVRNSEKEELEITDSLDSISALFMLAFLDKLDNDFPEEGEENEDDL